VVSGESVVGGGLAVLVLCVLLMTQTQIPVPIRPRYEPQD